MIIANILQNAFSMFEVFLLGKLGVSALAAFAIAGTILLLFWSFQGGIVTGCIVVTTRLNGENRHGELNRAIFQMLTVGFTSALLYSVMLYIFLNPVAKFFGARGETLVLVKEYIPVFLAGLIFLGIEFVFVGVLRGFGDSQTPLKVISASVIINAIAAPVLIFGFGSVPAMGIKGAAMANIISWFFSCAVMVFLFTRGIHGLRLKKENMRIDAGLIDRYIRVTVPAMGQGFVANIGNIILLRIIAPFGDTLIAAFGIWQKLFFLVMMFGWPIGNSGGVIVGYHVGKKIIERVKETVNSGIRTYAWITGAAFIIFFFFAELIMRGLTQDPEVIKYGVVFIRIITPVFVPMGMVLIIHAAFNGAGSTHIPTIINFFAFVMVQLTLAYTLPGLTPLGPKGIPLAICAAYVVQAVLTYPIYKKGLWIKEKI